MMKQDGMGGGAWKEMKGWSFGWGVPKEPAQLGNWA